MSARGIRNNNPGNIRKGKDKWQGAIGPQNDKAFVTFDSMVWGIRAMARILIVQYFDKRNLNTVTKIINRWAPPLENDTKAYISAVSRSMGKGPNEKLDLHKFDDLCRLIHGIIEHENGGMGGITQDQITKALVMSGVEPKQKALPNTATSKAATIAGAATAGSAVAPPLIHEIHNQLQPYADLSDYVRWGLLCLTLVALGFIFYHQYVKRKQGLA